MFKLFIILLLIIFFIIFFFIFYLLNNIFKIHINKNKVKYSIGSISRTIFKYYGNTMTIDNAIDNELLFYYLDEWTIKNNNYIHIDNKYYILEKGYYYYIKNRSSLVINNNDAKIILLNITNNRIKIND